MLLVSGVAQADGGVGLRRQVPDGVAVDRGRFGAHVAVVGFVPVELRARADARQAGCGQAAEQHGEIGIAAWNWLRVSSVPVVM
jgi:hypothetical protein